MRTQRTNRSLARLGLIALVQCLLGAGAAGWVHASTPALPDDPGLADYVALALQRNRRAQAALHEWEAASARVPQVGALPDPVLSYAHYLEEVETRTGPQRQRIGLRQSLPWFGTLGSREQAALAAANGVHHNYGRVLQEVRRDVTVAYAEYYYLAAAIETMRENEELLRLWERALSARYTAADATYASLIQAQMEVAKLDDRLQSLREQRRFRIARLGALLDLPAQAELPAPSRLPAEPGLPPREQLRRELLERNPELLALRAQVESHERGVDVARKESYPDFTLGVEWIRTDPRHISGLDNDGADPIVATLGVRLPLWFGKNSAHRDEAAARGLAATERLAERETTLASELENLAYGFEDAQRKIELYEHSLIPKANQTLQVEYAGFETGEESFLSVLDAQRTLLELRLSLQRARVDRLQTRAGIDAMLGRELPEGVSR